MSSAISSIAFDGDTTMRIISRGAVRQGTLTVRFTDGSSYDYHDVPREVYLEFKRSGPSGGYFNRNIRNNYRF